MSLLIFGISGMFVYYYLSKGQKETVEFSKQIAKRDAMKRAVAVMMANDSLEEGLAALNCAEIEFPDDPQIPFLKAMIWRLKKKEAAVNKSLRRSCFVYDSLLQIRPSFSDAVNKAFCKQFLNGDAAYIEELNAIKQSKVYEDTLKHVDFNLYYELIIPYDNFIEKTMQGYNKK